MPLNSQEFYNVYNAIDNLRAGMKRLRRGITIHTRQALKESALLSQSIERKIGEIINELQNIKCQRYHLCIPLTVPPAFPFTAVQASLQFTQKQTLVFHRITETSKLEMTLRITKFSLSQGIHFFSLVTLTLLLSCLMLDLMCIHQEQQGTSAFTENLMGEMTSLRCGHALSAN